MYESIETIERLQVGDVEVRPLKSWENGSTRIHCIMDDRCYLFVSEYGGTHAYLQWIPVEIISSLLNEPRTLDPQCAE
jgi:hypothetical protein